MNPTRRRRLAASAQLLAIAMILLWTLYLLWWGVALSIKRPPDFFTPRALPWLQFQPTPDNWAFEFDAFDDPAGLGASLAGSILTGVASTAGVVGFRAGAAAAPGAAGRGGFCLLRSHVQQHAQTAPLAVASLLNKDGIEFEYVGSHLLVVVVPPLLLALLARRYVVRGLPLGAVKEDGGGESSSPRS